MDYQVNVIEFHLANDTNILYSIFTTNGSKWDGKFGVKSKDMDCEEVISLAYYSTLESATVAYNKMIATS